jgi:hypothetical protein
MSERGQQIEMVLTVVVATGGFLLFLELLKRLGGV